MTESPDIYILPEGKYTGASVHDPALTDMIEGCIAGDRAAQEKFYRKYYGKMMSMCMRYMQNRDDAMEVLNTGFLKVFKNLENYRNSGPLEGWIYRIIYNSVIDAVRKKTRGIRTEEISESEYELSAGTCTAQNLYAQDLLTMLNMLPDATRAVFNMFAIEGFRHDEIAEIMNISEGTSKWHVNRARTILKPLIQKHG